MSTPASGIGGRSAAAEAPRRPSSLPAAQPWIGRVLLGSLCLAAALGASRLGAATPELLEADPELAWLLRAMAMIKAVLVAPALALVWWRFSRPVALWQGTTYLAGASLMVAACVVIWNLVFLPAAAVAFHLGLLALLLGAWSDRSLVPALRR